MLFNTAISLFSLSLAASSVLAISNRPVTDIATSDNYSKQCEGRRTDQRHPCFTFNHGSLANARIQMSGEEIASPDNFFLKTDQQYRDFTVADPAKDFTLNWHQGMIILNYSGQDRNGCFTIEIEAGQGYDVGVTSDDGRRVSTSTVHSKSLPGRRTKISAPICTKWVQISVWE